MNRAIILLTLFALMAELGAGALGKADQEYYTERPMFQSRPDPTRERYFGGIGTTGLKDAEEKLIAEAAKKTAVVKSGNFSMGVNLIAALTKRVAKTLGVLGVLRGEQVERPDTDPRRRQP